MDARAVALAYRDALRQAPVRDASRTEILRQLRTNRPIGFVNGMWVTPIDMSRVYASAAVRSELPARLGGVPAGAALENLLPRDRIGLAFTPNQFADGVLGDVTGDITESLAGDRFAANATGIAIPAAVGGSAGGLVVVISVGVAASVVGNYLYDWLTADPAADPNTGLPMDDPNADPDGDGVPNRLDGDDDDDGVGDDEDSYPHDPKQSICMCGRGGMTAAVFTNSFSRDLMQVSLNALQLAQANGASRHTLSAARVAEGARRVSTPAVTIVVPATVR